MNVLAKISADLSIEHMEEGVVFRVLSQSQSSFASLKLSPYFFARCIKTGSAYARCKLTTKNVLTAFKSLGTVDRMHLRLSTVDKYEWRRWLCV